MTNKSEHEGNKKQELHEPGLRQVGISAIGEIVAFSLAIGAVYVSQSILPRQTEAFVASLAENIGRWRGVAPETQKVLAKKILDVSIMNIAGITGMAAQFVIRRKNQQEGGKTSFWYEAGRLMTGRLVGTFTAISSLALMEKKSPEFMREIETGISKKLRSSERFSELLVSNAIQSAGAIVGNAPAQLLYDYLVNPSKKDVNKGMPR